MALKYDYPFITNVSYLKGHDLLVDFNDGSSRVIDLSEILSIPAAFNFYPIEEFKQFGFDEDAVWWGPRESKDSIEVGADTLYSMSMEIPDFISSISCRIQSLAMSTVFHEHEPYDVLGRVRTGETEVPHVHLTFKNITYQVVLEDGRILRPKGCSTKIREFLKPYVFKYREAIVADWNKTNPNYPADPKTGKFVDRR
jgi:hypothetical protein